MTVGLFANTNIGRIFVLTHTMVAGGPFFGATGYNRVAGPIGSLSPLTFDGITVDAVQHSTSGPHISIILAQVVAQNRWFRIRYESSDANYNGLEFDSADASEFLTTASTSEWRFPHTPAHIAAVTYTLDWT